MSNYRFNNKPSIDLSYSPELWMARNYIDGHSVVHDFGHNDAIGTTYEPIVAGGIWNTPQPADATAVRVKAGNANDTNGGTGAWELIIEGIDDTGAQVFETLTLAGASPSAPTITEFIRIISANVTKSGTYGTQSTASHTAAIVIENAAGGTDWASITIDGFGHSQTQIGMYTVPLGYTAFLFSYALEIESNKPLDVIFIKRGGILDASSPYQAVRVFEELKALEAPYSETFANPIKFDELTDFGPMARVASQTAKVSVDMEIVLVKN